MTDNQISNSLSIENALLRGDLFLALAALKRYAQAPHSKTEAARPEEALLTVTVPEATRDKALEAITRGTARLQEKEPGK